MQTNCPQCSVPIQAGAKFCAQCGASLAPPKPARCPNPSCGAPLDGTEVFCSSCGRKIEEGSAYRRDKAKMPTEEKSSPVQANAELTPDEADRGLDEIDDILNTSNGPVQVTLKDDALYVLCEICGAHVKERNLDLHLKKVHPDSDASLAYAPRGSDANKFREGLQLAYDRFCEVNEDERGKKAAAELVFRGMVAGGIDKGVLDPDMVPADVMKLALTELVCRLIDFGWLRPRTQQ